jgi:hypothetical protein
VPLALKAYKVLQDQRVLLAHKVILVPRDPLVLKVFKVTQGLLDPLAPQDPRAYKAQWVLKEPLERRELWVLKVQQAHRVFRVLMVTLVVQRLIIRSQPPQQIPIQAQGLFVLTTQPYHLLLKCTSMIPMMLLQIFNHSLEQLTIQLRLSKVTLESLIVSMLTILHCSLSPPSQNRQATL